MRYNAFISYSHNQDSLIAPSIEEALEKFAKPLFKKRALEIFRDSNDLSASPDLWGDIEEGLKKSEFFIFLASPSAAQSKWCEKEIEYWKKNKSIRNILIVLTDGDLIWDDEKGDFDWEKTNAIPEILSGSFMNEPLFVDFKSSFNKNDLTLENPDFKSKLVLLAATLHGKSVGDMVGEAARNHRRIIQLRNTTIIILLAFLGYSVFQTLRTLEEKEIAQANYLFSEANYFSEKDPTFSFALAIEGMKKRTEDKKFENQAREIYAKYIFYTSTMQHDSTVTCVEFSPDGKSIVSGSQDNSAKLWDLEGNLIQEFTGHSKGVISVAFSPDGQNIVTGSEDNTAKLWDLKGELLHEYITDEDSGGIASIAFTPDGETFVTGSYLGIVQIWDLKGNLIPDEGSRFESSFGSGEDLTISPDGTKIVGCSSGIASITFWDLSLYQHHFTFDYDDGLLRFSSIIYSPTGDRIITGDSYGVRSWNLDGDKEDILDQRNVTDLDVSSDGETLIYGSWDGTANLYSLKHKNPIWTPKTYPVYGHGEEIWDNEKLPEPRLIGHLDEITSLDFSPDNSKIVTGSRDGTARIWDLNNRIRKEIFSIPNNSDRLSSASFSNNGEAIIIQYVEGITNLYDLNGNLIVKNNADGYESAHSSRNLNGELQWEVGTHNDESVYLFSEDGSFAMKQTDFDPNSGVTIFDLKNEIEIEMNMYQNVVGSRLYGIPSVLDPAPPINSFIVLPKRKLILLASNDNTIHLFDLEGNLIMKLIGDPNYQSIQSIDFSPVTGKIMCLYGDSTIEIWNLPQTFEEYIANKKFQQLSDSQKGKYLIE